MLITILLLIFTVIIVPYVCIAYGLNPNDVQDAILYQMTLSVGIVIAYCFFVGDEGKCGRFAFPFVPKKM